MLLEKQDWSAGQYLGIAAPALASDPIVDRSPRHLQARPSPLTPLEQSTVALSLFDHQSSIAPPGMTARFLGWAFGLRPVNQLADARLEALRRYCILLRASHGVPLVTDRDQMRAVGYTDAALDEAGRLVAVARSRS